MATRQRVLRKRRPVLGDFDPAHYVTERRTARAPDGTEIPVSLVYRTGMALDGSAPLWLEGYGAYGYPNDVYFSSSRLSLLDRGVIYAVAHIRGGGDLGKAWHDAGRMLNKMHTFTDFIAVAETLIRERYTSSDRLAIAGGSAGGLLMGAVTNMRPDLFKVVLLASALRRCAVNDAGRQLAADRGRIRGMGQSPQQAVLPIHAAILALRQYRTARPTRRCW